MPSCSVCPCQGPSLSCSRAATCELWTRVCCMESLSLSVTVPSSTESLSTVMHHGVPTSSYTQNTRNTYNSWLLLDRCLQH